MSQDSNFSDRNDGQGPYVEPLSEAPSDPPPPASTSEGDDSNVTETSAGSTPAVPTETPSTEASTSTVGGFYASASSESQSFAPEQTDTSFAQAPLQPSQAQQYQNQQPQPQQQWTVAQVKPRNPLLYALVDFLNTGLGLIVQGRVGLGALFLGTNIVASLPLFIPFLGWILFFLISLPDWIISRDMAFTTAINWNRQHGIIS